MRSKRWVPGVAAAALVVAIGGAATRARAGEACALDGKSYPENAVVCSHGLQVHCVNGVWQGNEGVRCDVPTGDYVGPGRPYQEKSDEPIPEFYLKKYPWLEQK